MGIYNILAIALIGGTIIFALFGVIREHSTTLAIFTLFSVLVGVILFPMASQIILKAMGVDTTAPAQEDRILETINLAALNDGSSTSSKTRQGFLSSTTATDQKNVYKFVKKTPSGGYMIDQIDATGVEIFEDASPTTARIEKKQCHILDSSYARLWGNKCGPVVTTVHIPKGSIVHDYTIDLKDR